MPLDVYGHLPEGHIEIIDPRIIRVIDISYDGQPGQDLSGGFGQIGRAYALMEYLDVVVLRLAPVVVPRSRSCECLGLGDVLLGRGIKCVLTIERELEDPNSLRATGPAHASQAANHIQKSAILVSQSKSK